MANLVPMPRMQFLDANGNPLASGKLHTYIGGTVNTPLATYTTAAGNVENANPVILDSGGWANIWLSTANYKLVLADSADTVIWTVDNVTAATSYADIQAAIAAVYAAFAANTGAALVGTISPFSGASARTVQAALNDSLTVTQFPGIDLTGA